MTGSVKRTGDEVARLNDKRRPARTLGVLATLSLIFGILGMGEIFEDTLRVARNSVFPADAKSVFDRQKREAPPRTVPRPERQPSRGPSIER